MAQESMQQPSAEVLALAQEITRDPFIPEHEFEIAPEAPTEEEKVESPQVTEAYRDFLAKSALL